MNGKTPQGTTPEAFQELGHHPNSERTTTKS